MKYKLDIILENETELKNIVKKITKNPNHNLKQLSVDPINPPTNKQLYYLEKNEVPIPDMITFDQASDLISKHKEGTR